MAWEVGAGCAVQCALRVQAAASAPLLLMAVPAAPFEALKWWVAGRPLAERRTLADGAPPPPRRPPSPLRGDGWHLERQHLDGACGTAPAFTGGGCQSGAVPTVNRTVWELTAKKTTTEVTLRRAAPE